jgi:hypothetical protein
MLGHMAAHMLDLKAERNADLKRAVERAEAFLIERQNADGLWRDYELEPGPSEAWTTACVTWALVSAPINSRSAQAVRAAADALHAIRVAGGWGYNRHTASDADTTAWVWRVLGTLDDGRGLFASECLQRYVTPLGAARTFHNTERFGTWSQEHADVTPLVGLALIAVGAGRHVVDRLRSAAMGARMQGGAWCSFWWSTDAYATARNLEFLAASGGLSSEVCGDVQTWMSDRPAPRSPFEAAHLLLASALLERSPSQLCAQLVETLLEWQMEDGGWPASKVLLGPDQDKESTRPASVHSDLNRIMSTAQVCEILKMRVLFGSPRTQSFMRTHSWRFIPQKREP